MNEKGAGATGKECLGEAVRCGMASGTFSLPLRNQHIDSDLEVSGLTLASAAGASGGSTAARVA